MPSHGAAFAFLDDHTREIFGELRSMLYVGHRGDTHPWWRTNFAGRIGLHPYVSRAPAIDIVDIQPGNLPHDLVNDGLVRACYHGDIRSYPARDYGIVFWDEGPEHVAREEALEILTRLAADNDHVLISCPWGYMPQGSGPADPEFHHWGPQPEDFRSIGFRAEVFGEMFDGHGHGHGNLIAWI